MPAFSPFPTMFSDGFFFKVVKTRDWLVTGQNVNSCTYWLQLVILHWIRNHWQKINWFNSWDSRVRSIDWLIELYFTPLLTHIIHAFLGFTSTRLGSEVSCPRTLPRKNPEDPVRLKPRTPGLRVKHFTTGPHGTQSKIKLYVCGGWSSAAPTTKSILGGE